MLSRKSRDTVSKSLLRRKLIRGIRKRVHNQPAEDTPTTVIPAVKAPETRKMIADFFRPSRSQVVIALILFFTGLLIVMGVSAGRKEVSFSSMRRADLVSMLDTLNADSIKLQTEIDKLTITKTRLESGSGVAAVAKEEAIKRLNTMQILAGIKPATGPGIRITINDPKSKVSPELVLDAIEELRDAGAEVIQLNEHIRVVADTWFGRDSANNVIASGQRVTFPLTIQAIGDSTTLEAGTRFRGGLISEVQSEAVGGTAIVKQVQKLQITAVITPKAPIWAKSGS